jgi:glycosyltransferase involved in cell wall biosynthesis
MNDSFTVSVIIPVYNAEKYVRLAVESAVHLPEVGEIILVEDGFQDNALEICKQLVNKYPKVKLYRHPNGENRGAGASRNVGISKAQFDFISFLDADDLYLPHRFTKAAQIFKNDANVDGVYEPVGLHFYSENGKNMYMQFEQLTPKQLEVHHSKIHKRLEGKDVFENFFIANTGRFQTDGLTLKKEVIKYAGTFNESLRLHQDHELWIRIAYHCNLVPGEFDNPVALRGLHDENRITRQKSRHSNYLYCEALFEYFIKGKRRLKPSTKYKIIKMYIRSRPDIERLKPGSLKKYFFVGLRLLKAYIFY